MAALRDDIKGNEEDRKTHQYKTFIKNLYTRRSVMREAFGYFNWGLCDKKLRKQFYQHDEALAREYLEDIYHSYYALLYFNVVQPLLNKVEGKRLIEIGCATGKGLKLLSSLLRTQEQIGVDLNVNLLEISKTYFSDPSFGYITGDAEQLPLGDNSADIIVSVESSHQYPKPALFFKEVFRVLRPGGYFCYTDFSNPSYHQLDVLKALCKKDKTIKILKRKNITRKVQASIYDRLVNREQEFYDLIAKTYSGDKEKINQELVFSARLQGMAFLPKYKISYMAGKLQNFLLKDLTINCYHSKNWDKKLYLSYLIQKKK